LSAKGLDLSKQNFKDIHAINKKRWRGIVRKKGFEKRFLKIRKQAIGVGTC
jgi:hypothetical protein